MSKDYITIFCLVAFIVIIVAINVKWLCEK